MYYARGGGEGLQIRPLDGLPAPAGPPEEAGGEPLRRQRRRYGAKPLSAHTAKVVAATAPNGPSTAPKVSLRPSSFSSRVRVLRIGDFGWRCT